MISYSLTRYIYPLKEKISLLSSENIYFDNLRDDNSIFALSKILKENINLPPENEESINFVTAEKIINEYLIYCNSNNIQYRKDLSGIDFLASIWVVIKFEFNEEERREIVFKINKEKLGLGNDFSDEIAFLDNNDSFLQAFNYTYSISNFYAFLTNSYLSGSYSRNFLIFDSPNNLENIQFDFSQLLLENYVYIIALNSGEINESEQFLLFPEIENKILQIYPHVESILKDNNKYKSLEYIITQIFIICKNKLDERVQWLLLCGIVELLLTHNPDSNRFNVEDSISKQFKLKLGIILSKAEVDFDYVYLESELKDIYKIRSMIAHGDFPGLEKFLNGLVKRSNLKQDSDEDDIFSYDPKEILFENLLFKLYSHVQSLILFYLKNPEFVEFLKRN
jgi:hypothetical protein